MYGFKVTPWHITGTSGGSATVALPIGKLGAGGAYVRIKIRNEKTSAQATLHCPGIVGTAGVAVSLPINLDGSLSIFPSGGIGKLLSFGETELTVDDLVGAAVIISGTCKGIGGGQLSIISFQRILPRIPRDFTFGDFVGLITSSKAVGLYAGLVGGTTIGLGVEMGGYWVIPVAVGQEIPFDDATWYAMAHAI